MIQPDQDDVNALCVRLAHLLAGEGKRFNVKRIARVASSIFGDRIEVGDASRYLVHFARMRGYKIPPYPLAGNGEIKEFFADANVHNIPEWYALIGIGEQDYPHLQERTLVVAQDIHFRRKAFLLDGIYHTHDVGFLGLAESGLLSKMSDADLALLLADLFAFFEGKGDDTFVFSGSPQKK